MPSAEVGGRVRRAYQAALSIVHAIPAPVPAYAASTWEDQRVEEAYAEIMSLKQILGMHASIEIVKGEVSRVVKEAPDVEADLMVI